MRGFGQLVRDSYKGMSEWGRQVAGSRLRRAEPGARWVEYTTKEGPDGIAKRERVRFLLGVNQ
jgi:hypothetical protein